MSVVESDVNVETEADDKAPADGRAMTDPVAAAEAVTAVDAEEAPLAEQAEAGQAADGDEQDPTPAGPPPMTGEAAAAIVEEAKGYRVPNTWQGLLFHYVLNNGAPKEKNIRSVARVMEVAAAFDHHVWPLELREIVGGRDVLDFGCGATLHGPVFRALGAKTYTGVDRAVDHAKKKFRSRRTKSFENAGFSLADVSRLLPGVSYFRGDRVSSIAAFDVVVMQSVSHRALDLEALLQQLHRALRPSGKLWLNHVNFHSWSGHQRTPKSPSSYNPDVAEQFALADWRHVSDSPESLADADFNRVRLSEFRRMIDRLFDVEQWTVVREKKIVEDRLTKERRAQLSGYTDADLLTKSVTCIATKKAE
jgi:SAM-dependent methyltransferase